MRRWQLPPLRLAAPEAPAEQQGQEDPGGCWHRGDRERIHFSGAGGVLPLGPLPWRVSRELQLPGEEEAAQPGAEGAGRKRTLPTRPLRAPSLRGRPGTGP